MMRRKYYIVVTIRMNDSNNQTLKPLSPKPCTMIEKRKNASSTFRPSFATEFCRCEASSEHGGVGWGTEC